MRNGYLEVDKAYGELKKLPFEVSDSQRLTTIETSVPVFWEVIDKDELADSWYISASQITADLLAQ